MMNENMRTKIRDLRFILQNFNNFSFIHHNKEKIQNYNYLQQCKKHIEQVNE